MEKQEYKNPMWWSLVSNAPVSKGVLDKVCFEHGDGDIYMYMHDGCMKKMSVKNNVLDLK